MRQVWPVRRASLALAGILLLMLSQSGSSWSNALRASFYHTSSLSFPRTPILSRGITRTQNNSRFCFVLDLTDPLPISPPSLHSTIFSSCWVNGCTRLKTICSAFPWSCRRVRVLGREPLILLHIQPRPTASNIPQPSSSPKKLSLLLF